MEPRIGMGEAKVYIRMLGGFRVEQGGQVCDRFRTRKTAALLAYLATRLGRPERRDALLDLFWPESDLDSARNSLRVALSSLRSLVGDCLRVDRDAVCLDAESVETDVVEFERAARQAIAAAGGEELRRATAAYDGPLLPGYEAEWISTERSRLAELHGAVLRKLARTLARSEAYEEALAVARQAAEATPYHEGAHRTLFRLLLRTERVAEAREEYRTFVRRLRDDLHASPSTATRELGAQLSSGSFEKRSPDPGLAAPLDRFFGRDREIEALQSLLDRPDVRLVTLTGIGGTGKTRLAQQLLLTRPEPRRFVSCAYLNDPEAVPGTIAAALGVRPEPGVDPTAAIAARLGERPFLLVADNLEGLLEHGTVARWLTGLLGRAPQLKVVVTSRVPLEVSGEARLPVGPLPKPSGKNGDQEEDCPSVSLFLDRAQRRRPSFAPDAETLRWVCHLCRQVDGIPLAIELAATWINALTLPEMCGELARRGDLLSTGDASFAERHRSLRRVMQASYDLLPLSAQRVFRRVCLLPGGFTRELAIQVSPASDPWEIAEALALLQERSLTVEATANEDGVRRFRVLEPLREFGREACAEEELHDTMRRATDALIAITERSPVEVEGEGSVDWLAEVDREHANLGTALEWCERHDTERGMRLTGALARPWEVLTHFAEGQAWCERFLRHISAQTVGVRVGRLHYCAALMAHGLGDPAATEESFFQAELRFRAAGEWAMVCDILHRRIEALRFRRLRDQAEEAAEECVRLAEAHGIPRMLGYGLGAKADLIRDRGDHRAADRFYAEAAEIFERSHDLLGLCTITASHGYHLTEQGDLRPARALLERSLDLARRLRYRAGVAHRTWLLGNLEWKAGQIEAAAELYAQSLEMHRRDGDRRGMIYALGNLGIACLIQGRFEEGERHLWERLELAETTEDVGAVGQTLMFLGRIAWRSGAKGAARRHYGRCAAKAREAANGFRLGSALVELALLQIWEGDDEGARRSAAEARSAFGADAPRHVLLRCADSTLAERDGYPDRAQRLRRDGDAATLTDEVRWMIEPFGLIPTLVGSPSVL